MSPLLDYANDALPSAHILPPDAALLHVVMNDGMHTASAAPLHWRNLLGCNVQLNTNYY